MVNLDQTAAAGEEVLGGNQDDGIPWDSEDMPLPAAPPRPRCPRQFWKAGDYKPEDVKVDPTTLSSQTGLDHARIHPKFLHSNATSHKWALGAMAELLDNSMDEVATGATYVHVTKVELMMEGVLKPMLLIEDDGGGMDPQRLRQCMSFGFSGKRNNKNMIGQYGNGFKTSTMRLGADVLVFTRCAQTGTSSAGLLSYTFLTETGAQDVVVPIVDYDPDMQPVYPAGGETDWWNSCSVINRWSPFTSEAAIRRQLTHLEGHGTQVLIYNLWEMEESQLELDFDTDPADIRLRGPTATTTAEGKDKGFLRCMAYRNSLVAYARILYLRWPEGFRIMVRDKEIQRASIHDGMKYHKREEYRPRGDKMNERVEVILGFAQEAPETSVMGICVYHKNRLIKPFWKVYSSPSSRGRGVIGYLEADFIEPAHDKQDFERTETLNRLEAFLKRKLPQYWDYHGALVGYQVRPPEAKRNSNASGGSWGLGGHLGKRSVPGGMSPEVVVHEYGLRSGPVGHMAGGRGDQTGAEEVTPEAKRMRLLSGEDQEEVAGFLRFGGYADQVVYMPPPSGGQPSSWSLTPGGGGTPASLEGQRASSPHGVPALQYLRQGEVLNVKELLDTVEATKKEATRLREAVQWLWQNLTRSRLSTTECPQWLMEVVADCQALGGGRTSSPVRSLEDEKLNHRMSEPQDVLRRPLEQHPDNGEVEGGGVHQAAVDCEAHTTTPSRGACTPEIIIIDLMDPEPLLPERVHAEGSNGSQGEVWVKTEERQDVVMQNHVLVPCGTTHLGATSEPEPETGALHLCASMPLDQGVPKDGSGGLALGPVDMEECLY